MPELTTPQRNILKAYKNGSAHSENATVLFNLKLGGFLKYVPDESPFLEITRLGREALKSGYTDIFSVVGWHEDKVIKRFADLKKANKFCRGLGYTKDDSPILTGHPPVARVLNQAGECVYNPRFKKEATP